MQVRMNLARRVVLSFLRTSGRTDNLVTVTNGGDYAFLDADDLDDLFRKLHKEGIRARESNGRLTVPFGRTVGYEDLLDTLDNLDYIVDSN